MSPNRRSPTELLLLPLLVAGLFVCSSCDPTRKVVAFEPPPDAGGDTETETTSTSTLGCRTMDILFVVDNSDSMAEEQIGLGARFPDFLGVLEDYEQARGLELAYRIGVTTTSVRRTFTEVYGGLIEVPGRLDGTTEDGVLQGREACGLDAPWLESDDPLVEEKFACLAGVGLNGARVEMPMAAIELALGEQSEPGKPNAGFYRKDTNSLLVIVIVTDENDCSFEDGARIVNDNIYCNSESTGTYPPMRTFDFLVELTGGLDRFVIVTIAGDRDPQCTSGFGDTLYAPRLLELTALCGNNGTFGSLCEGDLAGPLGQGLSVMQTSCNQLRPI